MICIAVILFIFLGLVLYGICGCAATDYIYKKKGNLNLVRVIAILCPFWNMYLTYLHIIDLEGSFKNLVKRFYNEQLKW